MTNDHALSAEEQLSREHDRQTIDEMVLEVETGAVLLQRDTVQRTHEIYLEALETGIDVDDVGRAWAKDGRIHPDWTQSKDAYVNHALTRDEIARREFFADQQVRACIEEPIADLAELIHRCGLSLKRRARRRRPRIDEIARGIVEVRGDQWAADVLGAFVYFSGRETAKGGRLESTVERIRDDGVVRSRLRALCRPATKRGARLRPWTLSELQAALTDPGMAAELRRRVARECERKARQKERRKERRKELRAEREQTAES